MPTPRAHGGAALTRIPLTMPAFRGLNTQQSSGLLGPEWATVLQNAIIDDNGRVAARKGWGTLTTTPAAAAFVQGLEYLKANGQVELIMTTATKVYESSNGTSWNDVTGSASFTNGNWQLVNFNDQVYGFQSGKAPIWYSTSAGSFAHVSDVNVPTGGAGLAAFGRLWVVDADGTTVRYSALLDGSDWTSSDSGQISVAALWPGTDHVVALAAFNGALVIFGQNNIIVYTDGAGSAVGVDPTQLYVADTISGVGCYARDSVQGVQGDVWFLSAVGLQSMGRLIQERSNPIYNLSKNVQDNLVRDISNFTAADIRSVYSPENRFYLLSMPSSGTGQCYVFDTSGRMEDGSVRCVGIWDSLVPWVAIRQIDGTLLMSRYQNTGEIGSYTGYLDDTDEYIFNYESGWIDVTQQGYVLIPKRIDGLFYLDNSATVQVKWAFDFSDTFYSADMNFAVSGGVSEWNIAEWGLDEFGGGISLESGKVAGRGTGQYVKLGLQTAINNVQFAVQNLNLYVKIGRLA